MGFSTHQDPMEAQTNSFYHRVVKTWNELPEVVVNSKTINNFKNNIDELWKEDPIKFDYQHQHVHEMNDE